MIFSGSGVACSGGVVVCSGSVVVSLGVVPSGAVGSVDVDVGNIFSYKLHEDIEISIRKQRVSARYFFIEVLLYFLIKSLPFGALRLVFEKRRVRVLTAPQICG